MSEKLERLTARQRALLVALLSAVSIVYTHAHRHSPSLEPGRGPSGPARGGHASPRTPTACPSARCAVPRTSRLCSSGLWRWSAWPTGRVSDRAAPIPSIAAALATLLGVFAIGRRLSGAHTGFIALVVLATSPGFFFLGHEVLPDMMFTAWLTWALYFLLRGLDALPPRPRPSGGLLRLRRRRPVDQGTPGPHGDPGNLAACLASGAVRRLPSAAPVDGPGPSWRLTCCRGQSPMP